MEDTMKIFKSYIRGVIRASEKTTSRKQWETTTPKVWGKIRPGQDF